MDTLAAFDTDHLPLRAEDRLHRRLAALNRQRFVPALPDADWQQRQAERAALLQEEHDYLEALRGDISAAAAAAPTAPRDFRAWFEGLKESGPGQNDPLFPWLAERASRDQMRWYLRQEVAGEAGFDDLVALTQVKLPARAKLELARNYWDEMGRGQAKGMHGPMLETLSAALVLDPRVDETVWESLALANTMAGLAADRCYAYHAVGALGAIELTAPGRSAFVAAGLRRLGVPPGDRHYFDLHAILDVKHSAAWNEEVIESLVAEDPRIAIAIAEGALMRLTCGARCFARYRDILRVPA
ncbi:MAG TPA: iron-containing redox enzyme family protein [Candidatus Binataceae bacterium]|nr:iron-containing redox enzyme family protein [Candidatus Binataceae bacterium]